VRHRSIDPPFWWKPWLIPWFAFREWRERARPVKLVKREEPHTGS
jgi:hypothetical protein